MANPIITYSTKILSPGANLRVEQDPAHPENITAIYDDNAPALGVVLATCRVNIHYSNVQWTLNNDNSVTITGNIVADSLTRTRVYQGTTSIDYDVWTEFDSNRTFSAVVHGESSGYYDLNLPETFSITVPPLTESTAASIHFYSRWVNPGFAPDEFTVGVIVNNPNLPDYRPGKIYNGASWLSHNRAAGFEKIYTSSSTTREMRTQDGGVGTGNPPTIYNANWINDRKIGNE